MQSLKATDTFVNLNKFVQTGTQLKTDTILNPFSEEKQGGDPFKLRNRTTATTIRLWKLGLRAKRSLFEEKGKHPLVLFLVKMLLLILQCGGIG